jgi:SAM-dependent methyltransferase
MLPSVSTEESAVDKTPYSSSFFATQQEGSVESADIVIPIVLSLFKVTSVVDVGCGVGGWLQVFERYGINDYLGVDGDYVPREMLKIPADRFLAAELTTLTDIGRRFDLACSLEVAEHLPEERAEHFVAVLVRAAPVVLFSAAIPRQGGTAHLNEQWPTYWANLFAQHSYVAVDCIRPAIYGNDRIEWWYRQNVLVFCQRDEIPPGWQPTVTGYELNRVAPEMIENLATPGSGTKALDIIKRALPVLGKAVLRKARLG